MRTPLARLLVALVLAAGAPAAALAPARPAAAAAPATLTVFAAANLSLALRELAPGFEAATGARLTLVFGATANLARQIEQGAPADVFFSADAATVDDLQAKGEVVAGTRVVYAQGRLVLATAKDGEARPRRLEELLAPEVKRVAIANPETAPYGRAAREALEATGLWERVRPKLVYADNIRHAVQFLETRAVEAALVAQAVADVPGVEFVPLDARLHRPIDQAAGVTRRSANPDLARALVRFVMGPEGRPVLERHGLTVPRASGS